MPPKKAFKRPVVNDRDEEGEAVIVQSDGSSVLEKAAPYLLFKARIDLTQTTSNWSDGRSNRLPSSAHVKELKEMFLTGDIQRKDPEHRILLGTTTADFRLHFAEEIARTPNFTTDPIWRAAWVPGDKPETVYREADWGAHAPVQELEILAGQHRKQALKQCLEELGQPLQGHFYWICNVYDLTVMPANIRLELTANIVGPKKPHSSA